MKRFTEQQNIGTAKYVVNYHDGAKKHGDGSDFMDIRIFRNKVLKNRFVRSLVNDGYAGLIEDHVRPTRVAESVR